MKHLRSLLAAMVVVSATVPAAYAQGPGWLEDRSRAQGPGFRLGNFELHPGIGLEAGYDSNVFRRPNDGARPVLGSALFRISPHVHLSNLTEQRTREGEGRGEGQAARMFELEAGASSEVYFFMIDEARHNVGVNGHFDLNINPEGRVGLRLTETISRRVRPFTNQIDDIRRNWGQVINNASATVYGRTRGGLLQSSLGYDFGLVMFESSNFSGANRFIHRIAADTHFRFLPNTSLFWESTADLNDFRSDTGVGLRFASSWQLRSRIGINGAITPKVSATLAVGYNAVFVQDDRFSDFDTIIAHAGLKFRLTPTTSLGIGYDRDNQTAILGLYRLHDRGYLSFQWLMGRSFLLALNTSVAHLRFGDILDVSGMLLDRRTDVMVMAQIFGEYRFTDWLALNLTLGYVGDFTDFSFQVDADTGPLIEPAGFNKFEAWLGLRVFY